MISTVSLRPTPEEQPAVGDTDMQDLAYDVQEAKNQTLAPPVTLNRSSDIPLQLSMAFASLTAASQPQVDCNHYMGCCITICIACDITTWLMTYEGTDE